MKDTILSNIAWTFAKRYRTTILLWLILLVFGFLSYTTFLKKEGFPSVSPPIAIIQGTYFVDDANVVDKDIILPITQIINTEDTVESYQATSGPNFYSVFITFQEGADPEDGASNLTTLINDGASLPTNIKIDVAALDPSKFNNQYNLLLAVYLEEDTPYQLLESKAVIVVEALLNETGIESADVVPVFEDVINPASGEKVLRQTRINRNGITQNGTATFYPAVSIGVVKAGNIDDISLSKSVNGVLDDVQESGELEGYKTRVTADFAISISQQIDSLQKSLIGGLIAVMIVALLLIGWRAAIVVALFIPTVLATTFIGMHLFGLTINTITLFAVVLTLGLFVDDATIIVEAIDSRRKGVSEHMAVIKAAVGRVGIASLAGTLTTILVFAPMLFISGILGSFIIYLPITVMIALTVSFVISIILVPFMTRPLLLSRFGKGSVLDRLNFLDPVEKRMANFLSKLPLINKNNRKKGRKIAFAMVGLSILAVVGAGYFAKGLPLDIFPQSKDVDALQATVEFPPGTTIEQAEIITKKLDGNIVSAVGSELIYVTYQIANEREATIEIGLTPFTKREPIAGELIDKLMAAGEEIDGAKIKYSQLDAGPPSEDFPFQMRIFARDKTLLDRAAGEISNFAQTQNFTVSNNDVAVEGVKISAGDTITRTADGRFVTVSASFNDKDLTSQAVIELEAIITKEFNEEKLRALSLNSSALDFNVSQESENAESFSSVGVGLLLALVLMYLLLVVLFNSFSQPLLIFIAIPFSLFGVFLALSVSGHPLSFFVLLGMLGLIGIVVNNTILLTAYANQERERGADRYVAISNAVKDRFRPLITTTLTTVFALIPLSMRDPFWQPLAYTLIFGMISSTILIILSFPYYYLLLERIREWKNAKAPWLR